MGIKRTIAKHKSKARKRKETKTAEQIRKLGLKRNKALREADSALEKAKAQEKLRDAKIKRAKAKDLLNKERKAKIEKRTDHASRITRSVIKSARKTRKQIKKK